MIPERDWVWFAQTLILLSGLFSALLVACWAGYKFLSPKNGKNQKEEKRK